MIHSVDPSISIPGEIFQLQKWPSSGPKTVLRAALVRVSTRASRIRAREGRTHLFVTR